MLGNSGKAHAVMIYQITDGVFLSGYALEDIPTSRVGERLKDSVEVSIFNHLVKNMTR